MAKPIQHDTSKMSIGGALQTYLASVVETLVNTAIYEMCKLVDERTVFLKSLDLTEANEELKTQMQLGSEMMMVSIWCVTVTLVLGAQSCLPPRDMDLAVNLAECQFLSEAF